MITRTRIVVLLVVVAALLGIWKLDNRFDCALPERPTLVQIIEQVNPSVVYVEAYEHSEGHSYDGGGDYKLWSGSGVIIDPGGLVLTAAHVVEGANKFKVTLSDGRKFWSEESWHRSEISDVGFIQFDVKTYAQSGDCSVDVSDKLPVSYLGKSSGLRKGDDVFVVGCPFGYELRFTVTKGIVSGFGRDFDGYFGEKLLMQVDAQSWPGNSGGPIYNMQGQVVGILVGGYYGADGVGLCVPVDVIRLLYVMYEAEQILEGME